MSNEPISEQATTNAAPAEAAAKTDRTETGWQRELTQRLAHGATPQEIGVYLASHPTLRNDAIAFLHRERGNGFVQQALAAATNTPLSGEMLVSNNPEGLSSPGTIMSAHAKAGQLAAYIHHSNHTNAPLDVYVVVKPDKAPVTASLSGTSAVTGDDKRAHGGSGEWASDPNVVVAASNEDKQANANNRTNVTKVADSATPIKIGTLPAAGRGDPPLFDARYDVELSGDAELEIVAERAGSTSGGAAAKEHGVATGNTKYELGETMGRAAGMYEGANFASDDTALVSKLPFKKPLTGSKFTPDAPSPKATEQQHIVEPGPATLASIATESKRSIDAAAVLVLEHVFRIAPSWLTEKSVWDGSTLTTKGLSVDYATLINELKSALTQDRGNAELVATRAVIARHSSIGASLDAASYGTMFAVDVLVDNDTKATAALDMQFLTDAKAASAGRPGVVYRGLVTVDGVDHAIDSDTAHGLHPSTDLGTITLEPGQTKYVRTHFESPGQISAGQELDIKKK